MASHERMALSFMDLSIEIAYDEQMALSWAYMKWNNGGKESESCVGRNNEFYHKY